MKEPKVVSDEWEVSSFEEKGDTATIHLKKKNKKYYKIGDTFMFYKIEEKEPSYYMLVTSRFRKVTLINLETGNRWSDEIDVDLPSKITENELKKLMGSYFKYFTQIDLSIIPVTEIYEVLSDMRQLHSVSGLSVYDYHRKLHDIYDKILDWIKEGKKMNLSNIDYSKIDFNKLYEDIKFRGKEK